MIGRFSSRTGCATGQHGAYVLADITMYKIKEFIHIHYLLLRRSSDRGKLAASMARSTEHLRLRHRGAEKEIAYQ